MQGPALRYAPGYLEKPLIKSYRDLTLRGPAESVSPPRYMARFRTIISSFQMASYDETSVSHNCHVIQYELAPHLSSQIVIYWAFVVGGYVKIRGV